jgi:hypothetical protein
VEGLAHAGPSDYLARMRAFPRPSSPRAAWADLKAFVAGQSRRKFAFAALAAVIPAFLIGLFLLGAVEGEYRPPEITWVQTYDPDRTDAEIRAQQKIDTAERVKREAEIEAELERRRKPFKDQAEFLESLGL